MSGLKELLKVFDMLQKQNKELQAEVERLKALISDVVKNSTVDSIEAGEYLVVINDYAFEALLNEVKS